IKKGKQKIEIKFIESERARTTGADVGVMLFPPGGKSCSYGSTSIEEIIENFLKDKLEDRQHDYTEGKSNVKKRVLVHKILHPGSEIPQDKDMEEQKPALKLRVEKITKETQNSILVKHLKFDLNVSLET
ncbi:hypothetical protein H5410_005783, partial [Solanum commersonii]